MSIIINKRPRAGDYDDRGGHFDDKAPHSVLKIVLKNLFQENVSIRIKENRETSCCVFVLVLLCPRLSHTNADFSISVFNIWFDS
jgi:hypothetical protein